jgi:hypothetical protein
VLDEYLALGGVEIGNNARAYAYAQCLSCCAGLLKCPACDGIHDATNPWTNAVYGWVVQATNLVTNPSFEAASATPSEVRRNKILNPNFGGGSVAAGWGSYWSSLRTITTTNPMPGGNGSSCLVSKNPGTQAGQGMYTSAYPVAMGDVIHGIFRIRGEVGITLQIGFRTSTGYPTGGTTVTGDGQWHEYPLSMTVTSAATVTYGVGLQVNAMNSDTWADSAPMFQVDSALYENGTTGNYFDGTSLPAGDFTFAWTGTANASESVANGLLASFGVASSRQSCTAILSSEWASTGVRSVRVIPTQATNNSTFYATLGNLGLQVGKTYTAMAKARLTAPQTGSLNARARSLSLAVGGIIDQAPNEVGVFPLRVTFTIDGTVIPLTSALSLYNGASKGGGEVWFDDFLIVEGTYAGPYFDGATQDGEVVRYSWTGPVNASTSTWEQYIPTSPAVSTGEPPYDCSALSFAPWYDTTNPASQRLAGFYLLSVQGATDSTMTAPTTEGLEDGGVLGAQRNSTRSVRVREMIVACGMDAAEYGLAWLKAALSTSYCGRHGDGCGTSDLSFFIDCPPALSSTDPDYGASSTRYRRFLHGVGATSGPIIAEQYETTSGAYVIIVDFILTAESPFVWGETLDISGGGQTLTAYDDIPFNLMRYPSGEVGDGIPAVVATQYAFNGSVEYGATGWARDMVDYAAAEVVGGVSTDIAAVGPNSYRARALAAAAHATGELWLTYDVSLTGVPAGAKPSVSMWGAVLTFAGAPVLTDLTGNVEWRTASASLGATDLGTIPVNGGNLLGKGLTVPATATIARLRLRARVANVAIADDIRLYGDAFALTVP